MAFPLLATAGRFILGSAIGTGIKNIGKSLISSVVTKAPGILGGAGAFAIAAKVAGGKDVSAPQLIKETVAFKTSPVGYLTGSAVSFSKAHPLTAGAIGGGTALLAGSALVSSFNNPTPSPVVKESSIPKESEKEPTPGIVQNYYIQPNTPSASVQDSSVIPSPAVSGGSPLSPATQVIAKEPAQPRAKKKKAKKKKKKARSKKKKKKARSKKYKKRSR